MFTSVEIGHIFIGSDGCVMRRVGVGLKTEPAVIACRFEGKRSEPTKKEARPP